MKIFSSTALILLIFAASPASASEPLTITAIENGTLRSDRGTETHEKHEIFDVYAEYASIEGVPTYLTYVDSVYLVGMTDETIEYGFTWAGQAGYLKEGQFLVPTGETLVLSNGSPGRVSSSRQSSGFALKGITFFGIDFYSYILYSIMAYDPDPYRAIYGLAANLDFMFEIYDYLLIGSRVSAGTMPGVMIAEVSLGGAFLKSLIPDFALYTKLNIVVHQPGTDGMPPLEELGPVDDLRRKFSVEAGMYGILPIKRGPLQDRVYVDTSFRGYFYTPSAVLIEPVLSVKIGYRYL